MKKYGDYELRHVKEHIEVFLNGRFQFSADTISEARAEIKADEEERSHVD